MSGAHDRLTVPARAAAAVTKSDSENLPATCRGIYVGASGDLKVDLAEGGVGIVFVGLAAGVIHPIACKKVYSTGTTATSIVAVY